MNNYDEDAVYDNTDDQYGEEPGQEENLVEEQSPEEEQINTDHSVKKAKLRFACFVIPSSAKGPVTITLGSGIKLEHADHPEDFSKDTSNMLPNKIEVCNVTSNYFKTTQITFDNLAVDPYTNDHPEGEQWARFVVPGASTPLVPGVVKHQKVLEKPVHIDMVKYVQTFVGYTASNIHTKGVEKASTMAFVTGRDGWTDERGVFHHIHPVYAVAQHEKYSTDPAGRLIMPIADFDMAAEKAVKMVKAHQAPFDLKTLSLTIEPFNFMGKAESWSSLTELTTPADSKAVDRPYCITGEIKVMYHL